MIRTEYGDSLPGAALIFPLSNHKGQYDMGVGVGHCAVIQGRTYRLAEPIGEPRVGSDTAIDIATRRLSDRCRPSEDSNSFHSMASG